MREGGCQKSDDSTDRLRDMDSDIGGRGPKLWKNCVTSFMDGSSFVINISKKPERTKEGATRIQCKFKGALPRLF